MCASDCLYTRFIRDVDLDVQGPGLGDLILKWKNSSRCCRNVCQNSRSHQEALDEQGASMLPSGTVLALRESRLVGETATSQAESFPTVPAPPESVWHWGCGDE